MSVSFRNTINTGIHGPSTGSNPLEACFPQSPSPFWAGIQPFGDLCGTQDMQGTVGKEKWRAANWVITAIGGAGTTLVPTDAQMSKATFVTRATADGDGYNIQWSKDGGTTVSEIFLPTAGTLIVAYGRFKADNASTDAHTKSRFYFGIGDTDTDIHGSVLEFAGFYKASGAATMVGILDSSGGQTATSALANSLVDNTYISLGIRINGVTSAEFWQGTTAHDMTLSATQTTVTNIPVGESALSFQGETSEAAAITFHLQHLVAFQEAY